SACRGSCGRRPTVPALSRAQEKIGSASACRRRPVLRNSIVGWFSTSRKSGLFRCVSRSSTCVVIESARIVQETREASGSSPTSTTASPSANSPRTGLTIMCIARKPSRLWFWSSVHVPGAGMVRPFQVRVGRASILQFLPFMRIRARYHRVPGPPGGWWRAKAWDSRGSGQGKHGSRSGTGRFTPGVTGVMSVLIADGGLSGAAAQGIVGRMLGQVIALVVLVLGTAALGVWWSARQGAVRAPRETPAGIDWASAGIALAERVTFVQFSAEVCAACRSTSRVLGGLTGGAAGVGHREVLVDDHLDLVRSLGVLRTPTVLVVD